MKTKAFTRDERKHMVKLQFAIWIQRAGMPVQRTSYQIARALGLTPSSHLRAILDEMVEDEILLAHKESRSGRWQTTLYKLNPEQYTAPKTRQIAVKTAGKVQGQLELW